MHSALVMCLCGLPCTKLTPETWLRRRSEWSSASEIVPCESDLRTSTVSPAACFWMSTVVSSASSSGNGLVSVSQLYQPTARIVCAVDSHVHDGLYLRWQKQQVQYAKYYSRLITCGSYVRYFTYFDAPASSCPRLGGVGVNLVTDGFDHCPIK